MNVWWHLKNMQMDPVRVHRLYRDKSMAYTHGFRDARDGATEVALVVDQELDLLRAALMAVIEHYSEPTDDEPPFVAMVRSALSEGLLNGTHLGPECAKRGLSRSGAADDAGNIDSKGQYSDITDRG